MILVGIFVFALTIVVILTLTAPLYSYAFSLNLPIDCKIGEDCYIQNFVDVDPGDGAQDYRCGALSYDGHKGTDFRLINLAQMRRGVKVLAAADGTVKGVRNDMDDVNFRDATPDAIAKRECGNGLMLAHADGYKTQYCHMKKGSVTVKSGAQVRRGDVLGEVGLSGQTEFPHLHLQVTDADDQIIDPFSGPMQKSPCGRMGKSLWDSAIQQTLAYQDTAVLNAGFSPVAPDVKKMRDDPEALGRVDATSDVIALWVDLMGAKKGDVMFMMIKGPDGKQLVYHSSRFDKPMAAFFQFAGKKRTEERWPTGTYTGIITLRRGEDADAPLALKKEIEMVIGDPAQDHAGDNAASDVPKSNRTPAIDNETSQPN